jgi:hypothetical protein
MKGPGEGAVNSGAAVSGDAEEETNVRGRDDVERRECGGGCGTQIVLIGGDWVVGNSGLCRVKGRCGGRILVSGVVDAAALVSALDGANLAVARRFLLRLRLRLFALWLGLGLGFGLGLLLGCDAEELLD